MIRRLAKVCLELHVDPVIPLVKQEHPRPLFCKASLRLIELDQYFRFSFAESEELALAEKLVLAKAWSARCLPEKLDETSLASICRHMAWDACLKDLDDSYRRALNIFALVSRDVIRETSIFLYGMR